jgi:hypothetical protein
MRVLTRLRQHGLVINLEKCVFGAPSIDLLGYIISADGIWPSSACIEAAEKFPEPMH